MSLVKKWKAPNPNRQVGQISFRPAQHILAKLNALTKIYDRNKTEVINDLLEQAFKAFEEELRNIGGSRTEYEQDEMGNEYPVTVYNNEKEFIAYQEEYKEQLEKLRGESTEDK